MAYMQVMSDVHRQGWTKTPQKSCMETMSADCLMLTQDAKYDQVRPAVVAQQGYCIAEDAIDWLYNPWQGFQSAPEFQLRRSMYQQAASRGN